MTKINKININGVYDIINTRHHTVLIGEIKALLEVANKLKAIGYIFECAENIVSGAADGLLIINHSFRHEQIGNKIFYIPKGYINDGHLQAHYEVTEYYELKTRPVWSIK
jgi:hypothetical protein